MARLLAVFGVLWGLMLGPLGLSAVTSWLLIPGHAVFSVLVVLGTLVAAWGGYPRRVRFWGAWYLLASGAMVGGLFLGSHAQGQSLYWMVPWVGVLLWAWIPPVVVALARWFGVVVRQTRWHPRLRRAASAGDRPRSQ